MLEYLYQCQVGQNLLQAAVFNLPHIIFGHWNIMRGDYLVYIFNVKQSNVPALKRL